MVENQDFNTDQLLSIARQFSIAGECLGIRHFGSGHINKTYVSTWQESGVQRRYIHQHINHSIFRDIPLLMRNIQLVTEILQQLFASGGGELGETTLDLIRTKTEQLFYHDQLLGYWRTYSFIDGAESFDICPSQQHAFEAARTLGRFVSYLRELSPEQLGEPIPRFQDARYRYENFDQAVKADSHGRVKEVQAEIDFACQQRSVACALVDACSQGSIPLRITHADPKVNNVLFDGRSGKGICVVDLDTCMPGTLLYDFGDLVRSTSVTAAEDEKDLSKVGMSFDYFAALVAGYLQHTSNFLSLAEIELLHIAPRAIALTLGVRFLSDHLNGDSYFRIHRPNQNLDRARSQFQIARSMEQQAQQMQKEVTAARLKVKHVS